ncbi:pyrroloquinoline quinone biosynthesis peptide chaperone PqqD [Xanthobacter agilis]|jgi:pyrroloquinoline quinone biosynthesis protein D|uniref:Pyrroloquinoline quinone biosynthesis protein D n=1 Tax=Xanthobacter agilis TaxID=47492 RepID=A0ABU0LJ97_XANAG|nr:pyrroloquinoline quinone biosynthesis peptide chaperone PqqD [Xanthobacter agilis]MDQ0507218.1 pyrroloquinoline quinone biosynthesis protein D [Xanthobacter agilis]
MIAAETDVPRLPRGVKLKFDAVRQRHVLLAPERAFDIDAIAAAVLALVDGARTCGEIVDALAVQYDEQREVIAGDVLAMIGDLVARRVIER